MYLSRICVYFDNPSEILVIEVTPFWSKVRTINLSNLVFVILIYIVIFYFEI